MRRGVGSRVVRWLVVAAMCALPVQGFAGNVGTSDIIDGAVTTPKIADGAVTAAKLGIVCPDGQYLKFTVAGGWACNVGTPGPQGIQGIPGVKGDKGDIGLTGPQGIPGEQGVKGDKGDTGLQGLQGVKGDKGDTGAQGLPGEQGVKGDKGDTGATGPQGPIGLTGPQGPEGPQGPVGATGSQCPAGTAAKYAQVIVVAKSGGDFTDPIAAMESITDASATNPYLIKIMPGVYELNYWDGRYLNLKSFVDIEGSGEGVTKISMADALIGFVRTAGVTNAELRNLTFETIGMSQPIMGGKWAYLKIIEGDTTGSLKLSHVTLSAVAANWYQPMLIIYGPEKLSVSDCTFIATGGYGATAIWWGKELAVNNSTITFNSYGAVALQGAWDKLAINNSTVSVVGNAVANPLWGGSMIPNNLMAGIYLLGNGGQTLTITGSTIRALAGNTNYTTYSILSQGNVPLYPKVAHTQLDGAIFGNDLKCIGTYDANFEPITCH